MWRGSLSPTFKEQLPGPFSPFFSSSVEGRMDGTALLASPRGDPTLGLGKVGSYFLQFETRPLQAPGSP